MISNKKKKGVFLRIARDLRKEFSFIPILYGSLGLSIAIKEDIKTNDIDLLVPDEFVGRRWNDLLSFMRHRKFVLKNEKEHEFKRGGLIVAFAGNSALRDIGATAHSLPLHRAEGATFRLPTLHQFLATYEYSLRDGYRLEKRSDKEKIRILQNALLVKNGRIKP